MQLLHAPGSEVGCQGLACPKWGWLVKGSAQCLWLVTCYPTAHLAVVMAPAHRSFVAKRARSAGVAPTPHLMCFQRMSSFFGKNVFPKDEDIASSKCWRQNSNEGGPMHTDNLPPANRKPSQHADLVRALALKV